LGRKTGAYGWVVVLCATGINLTLGSLYAWSIFKSALETDFGFDAARSALPYTVSCIVFALTMTPAGRLQDRIGPGIVATLGGIFFGAGFIVTSMAASTEYQMLCLIIGFGVLTGIGTGFGYAATTPPAVKWFPPEKQGLIVGIVVGGVGLASVYVAPLTTYMINSESLDVMSTFRILGIAFLAAIVIFARFIRNPPEGYVPEHATTRTRVPSTTRTAPAAARDFSWKEMLGTPQFYLIWTMYLFGAGAGLMLISFAKSMAKGSIEELGFVLVAILAGGNAGGRLVGGILSDRIGRTRAMLLVFLLQAAMLGLLALFPAIPAVTIVSVIVIGFNYGACLSLFPSITADYFGLKNFGLNYGIMFSAWGFGSIMATVAGKIKVATGSYTHALALAAVLCIASAAMSLVVKPPSEKAAGVNTHE